MEPARGRVLVRHVETDETFPGSRILIPETSREMLSRNQMEIVAVGAEEECLYPEDCSQYTHRWVSLKECLHPIDPRIKPGAWCVIRPRSLVEVEEGLYAIRADEVLGIFTEETTNVSARDAAGFSDAVSDPSVSVPA